MRILESIAPKDAANLCCAQQPMGSRLKCVRKVKKRIVATTPKNGQESSGNRSRAGGADRRQPRQCRLSTWQKVLAIGGRSNTERSTFAHGDFLRDGRRWCVAILTRLLRRCLPKNWNPRSNAASNARGLNSNGAGVSGDNNLGLAIIAKLKALQRLLSAAAGGIYDSVPQNAAYPFIVVGEDRHTDESTDTGIRRRVRVQIDTWSRFRGREEVKSLQYLIELALKPRDS